MPEALLITQIALLCVTLAAVVAVPIVISRRAANKVKSEVSQLISQMDKNLAASVKLLEVRDYYETTSADLKKMLDEAYKEGNRARQEAIRKMMQRLDTLKARALDKTVKVLDGNGSRRSSKRRRKPRRPRNKPQQQGNAKNPQSSSTRSNRPRNASKPKPNGKPN